MIRLRELRQEHNWSMKEAAQKIGLPYTTYIGYEKGEREPNSEMLIKLADFFGVSVDYLIGNVNEPFFYLDNERILRDINSYTDTPTNTPTKIPTGFRPLPRMVKKPLVGSIACGEPITAEENIEDYVDVPEHVKCDFCLMCKGDSMIDANIHDGDIVYIRADVDVPNGQIAAVRIGEEATLKRIYLDRENGSLTLVPANSQYAPMTFTGAALADVHIEGKAVGFTHLL